MKFTKLVFICIMTLTISSFFWSNSLAVNQMNQPIAFVNVNVIPMDYEHILINQTVIIQDDRITFIGPKDNVQIPENAKRIEGKGKFHDFRFVAGVYESWHHFVTLEKNPIYTMQDLKGKKIAVGSAGSGAAANSENILKVLGIFDQVTPLYLTFGASGRALTDGHADAIGMSSAPMPAIVTAEAMHKIRLIELTDKELDMCVAKYPAYKKTVMPAGTYKSWQKPYNAIGFQVYWMAHKDLSSDAVYKMLKTAFSPKNKDFLGKVHKNLKNLSVPLKGMEQMGIPLHVGAVKYYKEDGMSIPANLIVD